MADQNPELSGGANSGYDLRKTLHSAVVFVRSVEANRAFGGFSLAHAVDEQIRSLKGKESRTIVDAKGASVGNRMSRWDRIEDLRSKTAKVVEKILEAQDDPSALSKIGVYEADTGGELT